MTFNDDIFSEFCNIWPGTTVREFSRALGRSTGYWNSVKSQNLELSDMALKNLQRTLETKIILAKHDAMKRKMMELQHKISQELVRRFVEQCEADDHMLEELEQILRTNGLRDFSSSMPMPVVITSNDAYGGFR